VAFEVRDATLLEAAEALGQLLGIEVELKDPLAIAAEASERRLSVTTRDIPAIDVLGALARFYSTDTVNLQSVAQMHGDGRVEVALTVDRYPAEITDLLQADFDIPLLPGNEALALLKQQSPVILRIQEPLPPFVARRRFGVQMQDAPVTIVMRGFARLCGLWSWVLPRPISGLEISGLTTDELSAAEKAHINQRVVRMYALRDDPEEPSAEFPYPGESVLTFLADPEQAWQSVLEATPKTYQHPPLRLIGALCEALRLSLPEAQRLQGLETGLHYEDLDLGQRVLLQALVMVYLYQRGYGRDAQQVNEPTPNPATALLEDLARTPDRTLLDERLAQSVLRYQIHYWWAEPVLGWRKYEGFSIQPAAGSVLEGEHPQFDYIGWPGVESREDVEQRVAREAGRFSSEGIRRFGPAIATPSGPMGDPALAAGVWPKFHGSLDNHGRSPHPGPDQPRLRWKLSLDGDGICSPVVGPDGTVYVGSQGAGPNQPGYLYAVEPTGDLRWRLPVGNSVEPAPAVTRGGTIYVCSNEGLYAVHADGRPLWSFRAGPVHQPISLTHQGTVLVSGDVLYALSPGGQLLWQFGEPGLKPTGVAVDWEDRLYFGAYDHHLYALDKEGTLRWKFAAGGILCGTPALASDGTVVFGGLDGYLYAVSPDGDLKWKFQTKDRIFASPAIGPDGTAYFGSWDGHVYAVGPEGQLRWRFATEDWVSSSPVIDGNGCVYVGSYDGHLYALRADGTLKWKFKTEQGIFSSPAIGSDSTLYFCGYDGYLYALQ